MKQVHLDSNINEICREIKFLYCFSSSLDLFCFIFNIQKGLLRLPQTFPISLVYDLLQRNNLEIKIDSYIIFLYNKSLYTHYLLNYQSHK